MPMGSKIGAVLAITFGWIMAIAIFLFLRTFDSVAPMWIWVIVVIAFLPRETYKVWKLLTEKDDAE